MEYHNLTMKNTFYKVFDNIGFDFIIQNDKFVMGNPLKGYNLLDSTQVGYYIPYIVRNHINNNIEYEIGVGYIIADNNKILIERYQIVKSSNNNQLVNFSNSNKREFYIFANETTFNTGFNKIGRAHV